MSPWKILIKQKKHLEHYKKIFIRSTAVHYMENSRFDACSIYFFQCYYDPLLVYEIAPITVESIEAKMNKYIWKWLALPPGLSDVTLYCRQGKLKLSFKSIVEEFKSKKIRLHMMLDDSKGKMIK